MKKGGLWKILLLLCGNILSLESITLILSCLILGYFLKWTPFFDKDTPSVLNRLIIFFFIPLIAIHRVPKIEFSLSLIWLGLSPFVIFAFSLLFFEVLSRLTSIDVHSKAALMLTAGIGSTSFVGFPIFELLYGSQGLEYGILLSLGGTIFVFNTAGLATLFYYSEGGYSVKAMLGKILRFLPFIAFLIGVLLNLIGFVFPSIVDVTLAKLVAPFSVIALLTIGMKIDLRLSSKLIKELLIGQFFKLILAPTLIFIITWHVLDMRDTVGRVCILGAAIGSMNAMSVLSAEKGLNPKLSTLMPAVGLPLSIPLLFLIDYLLK